MSTPPPPPPPGFPPGYPPTYNSSPSYAGAPRASFGARLAGQLLDGLLYGLLQTLFVGIGVVMILVAARDCVSKVQDANDAGVDNVTCTSSELNGPLLFLGIVVIAVGLLFVLALYARSLGRTGQTWGRKVMNVKVVDKNTMQPIGFGRAVGRTLFAWLFSGSFCWLGYLWMLWDNDKQTWHDKVVGSVVITA
jgi:uncharacterized RDD family membrane protein YckC